MSSALTAQRGLARRDGVVALPHELPGAFDLWVVDLDRYAKCASLEGLQADELERAAAFRFDRDRSRYLAGRHALRRLLAASLETEPSAVHLSAGRFGKPLVTGGAGGIHFNVSHSGHVALIALSPRAPVGVDVELLEPVVDADTLTESHFTADERRTFANTPVAARDRVFLQGWTRKEACLKAVGVGLTVDPRDVHAGCDTACRKVSLALEAGTVDTTVWTLETAGIPGTIAAIAIVAADSQSQFELSSTADGRRRHH